MTDIQAHAPPRPSLAVAMCTFNNERTLDLALGSVAPIAIKIVVVDSGSSDRTIEIARRHGAEVVHRDWPGPVDQKGYAIDRVGDHRWVLLLDSDEILGATLRRSIADTVSGDDPAYDGWKLNRIVRIFGTDLRFTFQPEHRLRLFRGGLGRVVGIGPGGMGGHDRVEVPGKVGLLEGDCIHDSWDDLDSMMRQYLNFARRAARYNPKGGRASDILLRPPLAMFKQYVLKQGFRDGRAGFFAASSVSCATLIKHLYIARCRWIEREAGSEPPGKADRAQKSESSRRVRRGEKD